MTNQRVTISMPQHLYEKLAAQIPARKMSSVVCEAVERYITSKESIPPESDPVSNFFQLAKKMKKKEDITIQEAIEKGRE